MKKLCLFSSFVLIFFSGVLNPVMAAVDDEIIGPVNIPVNIPGSGITDADEAKEGLTEFVRGGIRVAFLIGIAGVLFFFAIGGVRWILSGGDKQQIEQAKSMITAAIIGFAILALSYISLVIIGKFFGIKIVQDPVPKPAVSCHPLCPPGSNPIPGYDPYNQQDNIECTNLGGQFCRAGANCDWYCAVP